MKLKDISQGIFFRISYRSLVNLPYVLAIALTVHFIKLFNTIYSINSVCSSHQAEHKERKLYVCTDFFAVTLQRHPPVVLQCSWISLCPSGSWSLWGILAAEIPQELCSALWFIQCQSDLVQTSFISFADFSFFGQKNENTPLKFPLIIINRQQGTFFFWQIPYWEKAYFFSKPATTSTSIIGLH